LPSFVKSHSSIGMLRIFLFFLTLSGFLTSSFSTRISASRSISSSREWSTLRKYSQHVAGEGTNPLTDLDNMEAMDQEEYVPMSQDEVADVVATLTNSIAAESKLEMDLPVIGDGSMDVLVNKLAATISHISQLLGRLIEHARQAQAESKKPKDMVEVDNVTDAASNGESSLMWGLVSSVVGAATYVPRKATGLAMNATSAVVSTGANLGAHGIYKVLDSVVPAAVHTTGSAAMAAALGASVAMSPFLALVEKLDSDLLPLLLSATTLEKEAKVKQVLSRLFRNKEGVKATVLEQLHASSSQCRTVVVLQGNTGFGWSEWSWMLVWHALPKFLEGVADDVERMISQDAVDEAVLKSWGEKWSEAERFGMEDFHKTFALRHCDSVAAFVKHVVSQRRHECNDNARVILTGHGSGGAIAMSLGQAYKTPAVAFGAFGACGTDSECGVVPEKETSWNIVNIYGLAHRIGESRAHLCGYDLQDNGCGTNILIHGTSFFRLVSSWSVGLVSQTLQGFADNTFGVSVALTSWVDALKCQQRDNSWEVLRAIVQQQHSRWSLKCDADFPMTRGELEEEVKSLRGTTTTTTTTLPVDACSKRFTNGCKVYLKVKTTSHFVFLSDPVPLNQLKKWSSGRSFLVDPNMVISYNDNEWLVSGSGSASSRTGISKSPGFDIAIEVAAFTVPIGVKRSLPAVRYDFKTSRFEFEFIPFTSRSEEMPIYRTYPYSVLKNGNRLPRGVDVARRELFLREEEFQNVFGMTRKAFRDLSEDLRIFKMRKAELL